MAPLIQTGLALAIARLGTDAASVDAGIRSNEDGCTITAKLCRNFPEYTRTQFRDSIGETYGEAGASEASCMKRAEDFHHWCGNRGSDGAQVAVTFNPLQWSQIYHPDACDEGWSQWDAFCYKYHWEMKTWSEAEAACRQNDAHLVSIHSPAENRFVSTLQYGLKGWIGYSDVDKDTHYEWSDNTNDDFTNFAKNCTGRENKPDCKPDEVQRQWYSSSGQERSPYTCKRSVNVPGLVLLENTSSRLLIETAWSVLLPALPSHDHGVSQGIMNQEALSLKTKEFQNAAISPMGSVTHAEESNGKNVWPKLAVPKGTFF